MHVRITNYLVTVSLGRRFTPINVHKHSVQRYSPTMCWPQFFRLLCVETVKGSSVFSSNWIWRHTSQTHFRCPVTPFATAPGPL